MNVENSLSDADVLTRGPEYAEPRKKTRIKWYRPSLSREDLSRLNQRSDLLGFAQTLGFLAVLATSAGLAIYSFNHWPWYVTAMLVLVNGHFWHFLINGFHELIHESVFKTKWLNHFFLRVFSFLGWYNHHFFWASHTEHHKYTLHPPDDLEVVLPYQFDPRKLWKWGLINLRVPYDRIKSFAFAATGRINENDRWGNDLFPASDVKRRRQLTNWTRIVLIGHLAIAAVSVALGYWIVLLVVTFPTMFGAWLFMLCNTSQHIGMQDNVPDFRMCCRTIYLNPIVQFLYWHMNYHTEHHMFAAVPCYRLGELHRLIKHELPHCPNGLYETWKQVFAIQRKQEQDPDYKFTPELPPRTR